MAENTQNDVRQEGLFEVRKSQALRYLGHSSYVKIPPEITSLGRECFKDNTFLEVIHLPKNVQSVKDCCFQNCTNLRKVIMDSKNIHFTKGCFKGCDNLIEVCTTKQSQMDMGGFNFNGFVTLNLKEKNVTTTPTVTVTESMKDTIFELISSYYKGEYPYTVDEKLEIFIDDSLLQNNVAISLWENNRNEWYELLRLQRIAYEKLVTRQKDQLIKQLQSGGLDEAYDCLDSQAVEYKQLLKSQKVDRLAFLETFKHTQEIFNQNLLGIGYTSHSHGFEENSFE